MDYKKTNAPATQGMFMKLLPLLVSVLTRLVWKLKTIFLRN